MQPRIPWSRRIGIVVALVALGGTVVLAGGFLNGGKPGQNASASQPATTLDPTPRASVSVVPKGPTPRKAPVIAAPASAVTSNKTWTARVTVTKTGIARKDLQLRVYRNGTAVLKIKVGSGATLSVRNIPLVAGVNQISAAFLSPGGEGPRSNVVTITLDTAAPKITLTQPQDHAIVDAATVTLTGLTEPGAAIEVRNVTAPHTASATADAEGAFSVEIALADGGNDLDLTATDAAGNVGSAQLTVTRGSGVATAKLALSRESFRLKQLPATFDATLTVIDANGLAVDGATVTFSLSPPGAPTSTFQATTDAGRARWTGVTLSEGLQAGSGFVTARATLEDGSTLQATEAFTIR